MFKTCNYHGLTEFAKDSHNHFRCKKCMNEDVQNVRYRKKKLLVAYKGGKCQRCGYDKCIEALEFHHLNPDEKEYSLSRISTYSLEKLKQEADKCILLCANCHREIHAEQREERKTPLNNRISEEITDRIKELSQYKTVIEISKELELPKSGVYQILNNEGIKPIIKDKPLQDYTIELFKKQYLEVGSLLQVGKINGVSDNAIRKWLKKNNLPTKKEEIEKFLEKS